MGTVLAWGANGLGQLGDGTNSDRSTPVPVCAPGRTAPCNPHLRDVVAISAATTGAHSLALRKDGTVLAWGANTFGQLGDGTNSDRSTPVPVCAPGQTAPCTRFLTGVVAIAAGSSHSLALRKDGTVLAWGLNQFGQLGDGQPGIDQSTPVPVCAPGQTAPCTRFLTGVVAVAAGGGHSLALSADSTVLAWGLNNFGQLGDGTNSNFRSRPEPVCEPGQTAPCTRFLTGVHAISAGLAHSLALSKHGTVSAWGFNNFGQLGDGTNTNRDTPVSVCAPGQTAPCTRLLTGVHAISAGSSHNLTLRREGTVFAWGNNFNGQLGDGTDTNRNTPVPVCAPGQTATCTRFLAHADAISAGGSHSLVLREGGTVLAWGNNANGQLGDGTDTNRTTPVPVCAPGQAAPCTRLLTGAHAISGGNSFSLALAGHHESRHPK
ncbi:RCC1-like domain-containing protein [Kitasatospora kifunensis]|uniref:Alpha-tubulin suppressor-like RCC1 family protein n=1 Tax=Kitasatospora kifunensis TaxID=58351 RepID=A0A7W7R0N7_KITKI|nr:chromosome condensation regulator RCC1 [Kitasatospora kifunensis]MBB4923063.1 alpha-tubulin suppressor-like RCC1 family protein [Kitasatospora kifunensis]